MKTLKTILREMAGEISAVFMSQEVKGTEIVMPSEELLEITEKSSSQIKELLEGLVIEKKTFEKDEYDINSNCDFNYVNGFNSCVSELQEKIKKIIN